MDKQEKIDLVLSAIGEDWTTYAQIQNKISGKISVGGISLIIWDNINDLKDKIEWDAQVYGEKHWQNRMVFRKK